MTSLEKAYERLALAKLEYRLAAPEDRDEYDINDAYADVQAELDDIKERHRAAEYARLRWEEEHAEEAELDPMAYYDYLLTLR